MAYIQKNHPFPVTGCGRRRSFMTTDSPIKMYDNSPMKRTKPHTGGMSAAERKAYNNKTGGNVKGPQPGGGPRKDSYCARSAGIPKCDNPDKNGDCPNDIARRNWKCGPK
tara:strand:+ start:4077 stop:4406 length:330 start_codon:yes stop_codon:yes gene_type:complete